MVYRILRCKKCDPNKRPFVFQISKVHKDLCIAVSCYCNKCNKQIISSGQFFNEKTKSWKKIT